MKLTGEQMVKIIRDRKDGKSAKQLAQEYGVSVSTIYRVWQLTTVY